eukprot:scaffold14259_cov22-Tisochrysis_lutea.AAC.1
MESQTKRLDECSPFPPALPSIKGLNGCSSCPPCTLLHAQFDALLIKPDMSDGTSAREEHFSFSKQKKQYRLARQDCPETAAVTVLTMSFKAIYHPCPLGDHARLTRRLGETMRTLKEETKPRGGGANGGKAH